MKQIGCSHEDDWCYTYELNDCIIDLCNKCEKKLRLQIIEQIEVEGSL